VAVVVDQDLVAAQVARVVVALDLLEATQHPEEMEQSTPEVVEVVAVLDLKRVLTMLVVTADQEL
jgi:hypothetical protein